MHVASHFATKEEMKENNYYRSEKYILKNILKMVRKHHYMSTGMLRRQLFPSLELRISSTMLLPLELCQRTSLELWWWSLMWRWLRWRVLIIHTCIWPGYGGAHRSRPDDVGSPGSHRQPAHGLAAGNTGTHTVCLKSS